MNTMNMFPALDIAGAGMQAESRRLEIVAANIANANTIRTDAGEPYRRREVIFRTVMDQVHSGGRDLPSVEVADVVADPTDFKRVYKPGHPDADEEGFVRMPNVDMVFEMVDMMTSMRAFEANLRTTRTFRSMAEAALQIGR